MSGKGIFLSHLSNLLKVKYLRRNCFLNNKNMEEINATFNNFGVFLQQKEILKVANENRPVHCILVSLPSL
jgi:hypothetical protein